MIDALRELDGVPQEVPRLALRQEGRRTCASEVLKRLVDHEVYVARFYLKTITPRRRRCASRGRSSATRGRAASPSCCTRSGETYLHMGDPLRAKETFARVVSEYGARRRRAARSSTCEYIAQRYGAKPQPKPRRATAAPAPPRPAERPWMTRKTRVRDLVTRGRAHYAARRVRRGRSPASTEVLRENGALRGRLRHAGRHLSPGGAPGRGGGDVPRALRINPAYTEAALNLVVTYNDLGKYARGQGGVRARDGGVQARAARAGSVRQRQDRQHARRHRAPPIARSALFDEAVREYERALALCPTFVDIRTELGKTLREMGELPGADPRARARARGEPALRRRTASTSGLVYYAAGRRDDAAAEWRAVLEARPDNKLGADVPRDARPGGSHGRPRRPQRATSAPRRAARRARPSPLARHVRRRGDPRLRAGGRRDAHVPLDRKARPDDASTPSRGSRARWASRRATSATPG